MHVYIGVAAGLFGLFSSLTCALAGQLDDARAALVAKEYAKAAALFEPLAEQGNADAQYNLAQLAHAYNRRAEARFDISDLATDVSTSSMEPVR